MSFVFKFTPEKTHVFIHIPKNGGTSLWKILSEYNPHRDEKSRRPNKDFVGHLTYQETKVLFPADEELSFFCIVRNPWERMVSYYHYIKQVHPRKHGAKDLHENLKKGMPFDGFLEYVCQSNQTRYKPQLEYMIDTSHHLAVSDVLRLEYFQQDLNKFLAGLECNTNIDTQKHNASNHAHYTDYYKSDRSVEVVKNYEQGVVDFYHYRFDE